MQQLISLFTAYAGKTNPTLEALPSSGSNRRYYRLRQDEVSVIGVYGQSKEETHAFIELSRHFHKKRLNTPRCWLFPATKCFTFRKIWETVCFSMP